MREEDAMFGGMQEILGKGPWSVARVDCGFAISELTMSEADSTVNGHGGDEPKHGDDLPPHRQQLRRV
jgi:hypothetical protein